MIPRKENKTQESSILNCSQQLLLIVLIFIWKNMHQYPNEIITDMQSGGPMNTCV